MILPLQITFKNMKGSESVQEWIREEAGKLDTFYSRIVACRVTVEVPHRHHRKGARYLVRIDLTLPGGELVIKREPSVRKRPRRLGEAQHMEVSPPHRNLHVAIGDAFKAAGRRLQDYARRQDRRIKTHAPLPEGEVQMTFTEQ